MIIKAEDLKVGSQVAEADGFLFDVVEIVRETPKTITVRLCSDFSSNPAHWTTKRDGTPGGVLKTFQKSTKIYGIVATDDHKPAILRQENKRSRHQR